MSIIYTNITIDNKYEQTKLLLEYAAENGYFNILKWAHENDYLLRGADICSNAAPEGHFKILKWARENGCEWDRWVCSGAAKNGYFEILKWARKNGCDWDASIYKSMKYGYIEIADWAFENGCPSKN